jgi:predicted Zn-dependent protease
MRFTPRQLGEVADNSRGGKEGWRSRLKGIVSATVILGGLYLALGVVADLSVGLVSERTEAEWFSWTDDLLLDGVRAASPQLQAIFDKLIDGADLRPYDYRLLVMQDATPNAFALPGGTVTVTTGLLDMVEGELGRALVLGHELGHLQYRHGLKRISRSILLAGTMGFFGLDSSGVLEQSQFLAEMRHSRDQEAESDRFGLALVHAEYGTTEGAFEFFEDIRLLQGDSSSPFDGMQSWLHTHPLTEDRLSDLHEQAARLQR